MPLGNCVECGQADILGAGLDQDEPFFCCDCDVELQSYTPEERRSPWRARISRGQRAVGSGVAPASELSKVVFDPTSESQPVEILIDPDHVLFAGTGSEVWSTAAPLALHLRALLAQERVRHPEARPIHVLELGSGSGAVGIWLWRNCHPDVRICISDLPRFCPLLQLNVNAALESLQQSRDKSLVVETGTNEAEGHLPSLIVRPVRWGVPQDLVFFEDLPVDLVVGSDICYNPGKVEPLMSTIRALKPRLGAVLCLGLCEIRASGAWALQERCEELSWTWEERAVQGTDDKEALLINILPSYAAPIDAQRELRRLYKACKRIRWTLVIKHRLHW